jgi:hypothetical protein
MTEASRRVFMMRSLAAGCAFAASAVPTPARAAGHVEETDETAIALGYAHDTRMVDPKKYPNHTPQQQCSGCSFFQGAPVDVWAGCAMFGRKQIAAAGWCSAWARKPG